MIPTRRFASTLAAVTIAGLISTGCDGFRYIAAGPEVATGIGAKLLCSAEYVMGSDRQQAFDDMRQYSPILDQLDIRYDDAAQTVVASFWELDEKSASYLPGLGCALDLADTDQRRTLSTRALPNNNASWPAGDQVSSYRKPVQALLADIVDQDNAAGLNTRALLVVHDGRIVGEQYAQGADADTPLLGWSMAKSLTAVMLGNLEMRGLLDLSAAPQFKDWSQDARADIRIHHLLTMTDGLDFEERYAPGSDATTMLFTAPAAAEFVLTKAAAHPPGTRFNYSSGTANLLARLYLDTLGSPQQAYDDFFTHILRPMGMQNATLEMDTSGAFIGSSYFYASARDWARLGQMMLDQGVINDQRIVTADWVERATTPNTSNNEQAYGYQWWLNRGDRILRFPSLPEDAYFALGNREQSVMVAPSRRTVIVRLGWSDTDYPLDERFRDILSVLAQ